jgi:hypothetical protein
MEYLHSQSDNRGADLVDHKAHCDIKKLPERVKDGAELFAKAVVQSKTPPSADDSSGGGASPKRAFKVGGGRLPNGRVKPSRTFMVKPYFEDFGDWDGTYYPLAGFAEMATQSLLHAADLGDSAMRVHTFEDVKNKSKPLLAVELERGFRPVGYIVGETYTVPDSTKDNLIRIGIIDYLSNNQDRHGGNLMARIERVGRKNVATGLLAIDHGRSFQYRLGNRFADANQDIEHFMFHLASPAIKELLNPQGNGGARKLKEFLTPKRFTALIEWWKDCRGPIKDAFSEHIKTIRDAKVKAWVSSNFKERMATMDKLALHWQKSSKRADEIWKLDPEHIGPTFGEAAQKFVNKVRHNDHGEDFLGNNRYSDNDEGHNKEWCALCDMYHTG